MRKSKTFCLLTLGLTLVLLIIPVAVIAAMPALDPFFVVHGVGEGETALFNNQRYEMPGLIRNQDYSAVVMGTSLVANYRASWFTEGLGDQTLKVTFPDGWLTEFDAALDLAWASHPRLDTVFFGFDLNILIRPDSERTVELPGYLYNTNPLDKASYFWNKETYIQVMRSQIKRRQGGLQSLDDAYIWDGAYEFSREKCLSVHYRVPEVQPMKPEDTYLPAARENLAVVASWLEEHPGTHFTIWFAPYSILFWDSATRRGEVDACLAALELAWETLSRYENVSLYSFMGREEIITDLDNYTDALHCSGKVTRLEAEELMAGRDPVTAENYPQRLKELRAFVKGYDYDAIFAQEDTTER